MAKFGRSKPLCDVYVVKKIHSCREDRTHQHDESATQDAAVRTAGHGQWLAGLRCNVQRSCDGRVQAAMRSSSVGGRRVIWLRTKFGKKLVKLCAASVEVSKISNRRAVRVISRMIALSGESAANFKSPSRRTASVMQCNRTSTPVESSCLTCER